MKPLPDHDRASLSLFDADRLIGSISDFEPSEQDGHRAFAFRIAPRTKVDGGGKLAIYEGNDDHRKLVCEVSWGQGPMNDGRCVAFDRYSEPPRNIPTRVAKVIKVGPTRVRLQPARKQSRRK